MEMLRLLTAGSVDDGKSTLIGRLFYDSGKIADDHLEAMSSASRKQGNEGLNLAFFTDGLKAEREQGITIDVAYRYLDGSKRKFILADSPGHLEYTRNMVTAASQSDAALILIDVERGVTDQTRRHSWICQWLGIRHFAFCVNKFDRVFYDEQRFLAIEQDLRNWFKNFSSNLNLQFIPMSALLGEGVMKKSPNFSWYRGPSLMDWMNSVPSVPEETNKPAQYSVQMKILPKNSGENSSQAFAGKLIQGSIKVGDKLRLARSSAHLRVVRIEMFGVSAPQASAGDLATLVFDGNTDLSRGDVLTDLNTTLPSSDLWEVELCFLDSERLSLNASFLSHIGNLESTAEIISIDEELDLGSLQWKKSGVNSLHSNQIVKAKIKFQDRIHSEPFGVSAESGRMILIRDPSFETAAVVLLKNPL